jgi:hypothetical protein
MTVIIGISCAYWGSMTRDPMRISREEVKHSRLLDIYSVNAPAIHHRTVCAKTRNTMVAGTSALVPCAVNQSPVLLPTFIDLFISKATSSAPRLWHRFPQQQLQCSHLVATIAYHQHRIFVSCQSWVGYCHLSCTGDTYLSSVIPEIDALNHH